MSKMQTGDKFTIEGVGYSAKGHMVVNGRSTKTKRKMKVVTPLEYEVKEVVMAPIPDFVKSWTWESLPDKVYK